MWTKVIAASAGLAVAGLTLAYAQPFGGPDRDRGAQRIQRWLPSANDMKAFTDARVAAMKAGLALSADQEKNWRPFEDAYRDLAKLRIERILAWREGRVQPPGNIVEGMQRRAERWSEGAAAFKKLADAAVPLYQSLDDAQKNRFGVLARMLRPRPVRFGMRSEGMGPGMMAPGMRGDRPGWHMRQNRGEIDRDERPGFGPGGLGMERFRERGFDRPRFGGLPADSDPFADFTQSEDDSGHAFAEADRL